MKRNIIYIDLATQRTAGEVGGDANKAKMGVSVAVAYSTALGRYETYRIHEMHRLGEKLVEADLVVGWNHLRFAYTVLQPYLSQTLAEQTINVDIMLELESKLGFRPKLGDVASASLGASSGGGDGMDATRWWKEHQKSGDDEPLRRIAEHCRQRVESIKCLYEHACQQGKLLCSDSSGDVVECEVGWRLETGSCGSVPLRIH